MSIRRIFFFLLLAVAFLIATGIPIKSNPGPDDELVVGRNVNMVAGIEDFTGDPWLQRQNEPSIAVSTRNPLHLLAGANDYRAVDFVDVEELPGQEPTTSTNQRDAWLGVFKSFNGGQSWVSSLLPGFPLDTSQEGITSPLSGFGAAADPTVRAGANGMFYYNGIAFDRIKNGRSVLFVARYIDNNNVGYVDINNTEESSNTAIHDSIKYIDIAKIDEGTSGQFADKPWIAVDIPRGSSNISISGTDIPEQWIPAHNVYIVYSIFLGDLNSAKVHNKILFARSTNCGNTWEHPIKLSEGEHVNQGTTLAVSPIDGTIYVAWRRFASDSETDAILVCKSKDYGKNFNKPIEIATLDPFPYGAFDQGTSNTSFRTSAFPTIAVDDNGIVYVAWSQRMENLAGQARIVITASVNGIDWPSDPEPIDNSSSINGHHQIMPALTYAAGKLMMTWYDTRKSKGGYGFFIDDLDNTERHTLDVWITQAMPSNPDSFSNPNFDLPIQVSRYLYKGIVNGDYSNQTVEIEQFQFNRPNYPMFMGGTVPFLGDYIDISPAPMFLPASDGSWRFNTGYKVGDPDEEKLDPANFYVTWTDNRDVKRPKPDELEKWQTYYKPGTTDIYCDATGRRDQNIYTSQISQGIIIGSPGNTKPFTAEEIIDSITEDAIPVEDQNRTFLVFVKNLTKVKKAFRLTIIHPDPTPSYPKINLSFWQLGLPTEPPQPPWISWKEMEVDVWIDSYSSLTLTVFADCVENAHPDRHASFKVKVVEIEQIDEGWSPISGGFQSNILLNPDPINTAMIDYNFKEIHTPIIENVSSGYVFTKYPDSSELLDMTNYDPPDPDINYVNPDIIYNPHIRSPHIRSDNFVNPHIRSTNIGSINFGMVTDIQWSYQNDGNTTSAYSFTPFGEQLPNTQEDYLVESQLFVYRVHSTPKWACAAGEEQDHHELLVNIANPHIRSIDEAAPHIRSPHIRSNTFFLAPGESAIVTLRLIEKNQDPEFDPIEYAENVGGAVTPQAVNTGETEPATASSLIIVTKSSDLPKGSVNDDYIAALEAFGGTPHDYINDKPVYLGWSVVGSPTGEVLPGVVLSNDGKLTGIPTYDPPLGYQYPQPYSRPYTFTAQVQDNNTTPQSASKELNITVVCEVHTISITAGIGGEICHSYSVSGAEECIFVENGQDPATGSVDVIRGEDITFTIEPIFCWQVLDVLVDSYPVLPLDMNTYTFNDEGGGVRGDHAIEASFEIDTFIITATADPADGGTIDPDGNVIVSCGAAQTFTITPNEGYRVADVIVDEGTNLGIDTIEYTFENVTANHTIHAVFGKLEEWVERYNNDAVNKDDEPSDIAVDDFGNVHVTGYSWGSTTGRDFYTLSYDRGGYAFMEARYDGPAHKGDIANALAVDGSGNVHVTGHSYRGMPQKHSDYCTVRYDSLQELDWDVRYDARRNGNDVATDIAYFEDSSGRFVYVTGRSEDSLSKKSDVLHYDYYTIKYDVDNRKRFIWGMRYNNDSVANAQDEAAALAVDSSGNVYVTGRSQGNGTGFDIATIKYLPDRTQDPTWGNNEVPRYEGSFKDEAVAIAVDSSGLVYVAGYSSNSNNPEITSNDYIIIRYTPSGTPDTSWGTNGNGVVRYDGGNNNIATAIALGDTGVFVTGKSQGSGVGFDFVTIKFLHDGTKDTAWGDNGVVTYDGEIGDDEAVDIAVDSSENVYITGKSQGNGTGSDYYTIKYNNSGHVVWSARYNNSWEVDNNSVVNADDEAVAIAVDEKSGDVYVTGSSKGESKGFDYATVKYKQ